jgi:hypothetical protein
MHLHDIIADAKSTDRGHGNSQQDTSVATFRQPEALLFEPARSTWQVGERQLDVLYAAPAHRHLLRQWQQAIQLIRILMCSTPNPCTPPMTTTCDRQCRGRD